MYFYISQKKKKTFFVLITDEPQNHVPEDPFGEADFPEDPFIHSTPAPATVSLSEEQRRRIELNKQLALERRLARLQQQQEQGDLLSQENMPKISSVIKSASSYPRN